MTKTTVLPSKYQQMVGILKTAIERGRFPPGQPIPSEHELSRQHGISRNTVREAISSLVHQGLLTRTQGRGTFVAQRLPAASPSSAMYAVFIHAHEHVFETQTRAAVRFFQRQQALPLVFDLRELREPIQTEAIMEQLLDRSIAGLVIENEVLPMLRRVCQRRGCALPPLAVVNREAPADVPAINVVTDFEHGTRLGTTHLLKLGYRRILFVCHVNPHIPPGLRPDQESGEYGWVVRGYTGALFDAGMGHEEHLFLIRQELAYGSEERAALHRLLMEPHRPDAVFAYGDARAKHVIDIAADAGLRVPEDLAVIGYWNTPWADMTRVPLTSVSIREEEIARIAVERLLARSGEPSVERETIIVKPEIVIRRSCGAMTFSESSLEDKTGGSRKEP